MSRSRPGRALFATAAAAAVLMLASCAPAGDDGTGRGFTPPAVDVDVDTPALRAAKKAAGIADCPQPDGPTPQAEEPMPDVTLPCLGGGDPVDLTELRGPMVINLWAQWCPPCREELPYYQELHERAGDRLTVLGVDHLDTRPELAIELLAETGVTYPSLADPAGELRAPFRVRGLPGIVFLDEDGEVVAVEFVVIESFDQLADLVETHLGVSVGAAG
ncbi:TlpA family protein disulfide reductase [Nocardioides pakistanensis]